MTLSDFETLKIRFADYAKSFISSSRDDQNLLLKERHTYNVCDNIVTISKERSMNNDEILLAESIALFHDIGRFPQYAEFKTFRDDMSVNHGVLGAKTLTEERILRELPPKEQETILQAVKFHNAFALPRIEDPDSLVFLKLIRDADKLDIWRVFTEYYETPEEKRASAVGLGLLDAPGYSEKIIRSIREKRMASLSDMKTLNDFKLLQLSWLYDLNFAASFRLLLERDYIKRISAALPRTEEILGVTEILEKFAARRARPG